MPCDRLAVFTFQNMRTWRTLALEPMADGIIWKYGKGEHASVILSLLRSVFNGST
ncbi:hypothetical protein EDD17DRAFT_1527895 [Pisolithus thermaeus]|nr:hypothetical protein EDD17DRAFT_1527895 [Pisolithus thermaeus]